MFQKVFEYLVTIKYVQGLHDRDNIPIDKLLAIDKAKASIDVLLIYLLTKENHIYLELEFELILESKEHQCITLFSITQRTEP